MNSIFNDYSEYVDAQIVEGLSFESTSKLYVDGQNRYINQNLMSKDRNVKLLDAACGDGVGLRHFRELGFTNVTGIELSKEKSEMAKQSGYQVHNADIANIKDVISSKFDIIYSSHTLEHIYDPIKCLNDLNDLINPNGELYLVLPYPELKSKPSNPRQHRIHCGVAPLGLNILDNGKTLVTKLEQAGFIVKDVQFDNFREPEIWIRAIKR